MITLLARDIELRAHPYNKLYHGVQIPLPESRERYVPLHRLHDHLMGPYDRWNVAVMSTAESELR